jgi:hypothetical protein
MPAIPTYHGLRLMNRRGFLGSSLSGIGAIALTSLLNTERLLGATQSPFRPVIRPETPLAARLAPLVPKAKRLLMIFCSGAVSQVDTFEYKPALVKHHGEPMPGADKLITFQGAQGKLTQSFYPFKPRGQCGKMTTDLLPRIGELSDDICFIHSMTARSNTHGPGELQIGTGFTLDGYPAMGAWVSYALGTEAEDLPAFVAIPDPRGVPQTGAAQWGAGFLPAVFQGTAFGADKPIANLTRPGSIAPATDSASRDLLKRFNEEHLKRHPGDTDLAARIASYELAGKMQLSAAAVGDLSSEPAHIRAMYGADDTNKMKAGFGRNCLLARRLLEKGVRFVQVFNGSYSMGEGVANWDAHRFLKEQYDVHGPILDQGCAALIKDLKQRGMLEDTLIAWVTEFGRMPTLQKSSQGRDHNPKGFTVFLAGAGVKRGFSYGATDDFGYEAAQNVTTVYDLHATMLHLMGLDHERLSFYHNGIERRLTDVHGEVVRDILT